MAIWNCVCASCGNKAPLGQKGFLGTEHLGVCRVWAGGTRLQVLGLGLPVPAQPLKHAEVCLL